MKKTIFKGVLLSAFVFQIVSIRAWADSQAPAAPASQVVPLPNMAQIQSVGNPAMMQVLLAKDRQRIFAAGMALRADQQKIFWDIYSGYEKERSTLDGRSLELLNTYVLQFSNASDSQIQSMIEELASIQEKTGSLRKKYYERFADKLSPSVGGRFYQIDDLISAAVRLQTLGRLPLFVNNTPTP